MIGEVEPKHVPSPFELHHLWIISLIYSAKFVHRIKYERGGSKLILTLCNTPSDL